MERTLLASAILVCLLSSISADETRPQFPKAPVGFDDGRLALDEELRNSRADAADLFSRVFDGAGYAELAHFLATHLLSDEIADLDNLLELKGDLTRQVGAKAQRELLEARKITGARVIAALGKMLQARGYSAAEAAAWCYQRDINTQALATALGQTTHGARAIRNRLAACQDLGKGADAFFESAFWEFDLRDSTQVAGGHYDSLQLIESLLDLGVDSSVWAAALGHKKATDLSQGVNKLVAWADPAMLGGLLEGRSSERDLANAALAYLRQKSRKSAPDSMVAEQALRRTYLSQRWFRTAGPGIIGVYRGPWFLGKPTPPTEAALSIGSATGDDFATGLTEEIRNHWAVSENLLTLVLYSDGSARATLGLADNSKMTYGPDSPLGACQSSLMLFEGRASLPGKIGRLSLVFAGKTKPPLLEIEIEGLTVTKNGAFLTCQVDAGAAKNRPLLLRRISRNIALE